MADPVETNSDNDNQPGTTPPVRTPLRTLLDFGLVPDFANDASPDTAIAWVAGHLRSAASGTEPAALTVTAIRSFLSALPRGDLGRASPDLLANLYDAIEPVLHRLALEAPKGVTPNDIALGLGSLGFVVDLLRTQAPREELLKPSTHLRERLDLVALLADELDASLRRKRLDERGNHVSRMASMWAAMRQVDPTASPLH